MDYIQYIVIASVCLSMFYAVYSILFKKGLRFIHARAFLIASIVISLLIPLTQLKIETGFRWLGHKETLVVTGNFSDQTTPVNLQETKSIWDLIRNADPLKVALWVYISVSALLLLRLLFTLLLLTIRYRRSYKVHLPDCILLYNHGFRNTLSFFKWIFLNHDHTDDDDLSKIIAHEKIHVSQLHSADVLIIELLAAAMWFNPIIWMIRNSMKLVHEYLADEGALRTGISISGYQALLINQIAEERLVVLSSSFNHSLIKKRITMMTNSKNTGKSPVKLLLILPVATLLFITMAAFNGISADEMRNSGADEIPVLKNASVLPLAVDLPQDTIKKKTIIKKVSKENPTDTVIIEKEVIIIGNDKDMQHSGGGRRVHIIDGDGRERHTGDRDVIVHSHDISDEEEVDVFIERSGRHSDSLKHVEIITHGGDMNGEKVIIRHRSGDESDVLYIVDGEKMTDKSAIEILNPDEIQSMSVIKGEDAAKYGENYSGVIIITTKKPKK